MKTLIFAVLLIVTGTQSFFAQQVGTDQEIIKLSKDKWQWMADKDVKALDQLFDE